MSFDTDSNSLEMERALLATLCLRPSTDPGRVRLLHLLTRYRWQYGDHRAVYDSLAHWNAEPREIRQDLAARLTRLGFPDVDIAPFFEPSADTGAAFDWLISRLAPEASGSASDASRIHRSR
jgi:hypothetical protein